MNKVRKLDEQNFDHEVLESSVPVLVDFWAPWCPPCRAIAPAVESLAEEFDGVASVGKVNVDDNAALSQRFGITSIPTLLVFKDGEVIDRVQGVASYDVLAGKLKSVAVVAT